MDLHELSDRTYPLLQRHESRLQQLRHERKAERQRLDGLKKTLQTRLQINPKATNDARAS